MDAQILSQARSWLQMYYRERADAHDLRPATLSDGGVLHCESPPSEFAVVSRREFDGYLLSIGADVVTVSRECERRGWFQTMKRHGRHGQKTQVFLWIVPAVCEAKAESTNDQRGNDKPPAERSPGVAENTGESHKDGPEAPEFFWWKGSRRDGLRGNLFRLVNLLWDTPGRKATFEEVEEDWGGAVADKTIRNASSDLSCWFEKAAIPLTSRVKSRHVLLEE